MSFGSTDGSGESSWIKKPHTGMNEWLAVAIGKLFPRMQLAAMGSLVYETYHPFTNESELALGRSHEVAMALRCAYLAMHVVR
jgi:hypothetical protein